MRRDILTRATAKMSPIRLNSRTTGPGTKIALLESMILRAGSRVLIIHRRLFSEDSARIFAGVVDGYDAGIAKVRGHTWLRNIFDAEFMRKEDQRTKIISLSSGTLMVYELPDDTDMASLKFVTEKDGRVMM